MGWDWGKKLGGEAPAPVPAPYGPGVMPRGMGNGDHAQVIDHYLGGQQFRQPSYQAQPLTPEPWRQNNNDPTKVSEVLPIWQWQGNPRGGAKETAELGSCPNCGSPRFFSRSNGNSVTTNHGVFYPAPECYDCGYPREQGILAGSAAKSGPAQAARGADAPPPPGSMVYIKR